MRRSPKHLGEFEQLVLLAALRGGESADVTSIKRALDDRARRDVSRGAIYHTLDRLEAKGYVASEYEAAAEERPRGGHPRRRFQVTDAGVEAVRRSREALQRMWDGLEALESG